jgi:DNA invertase Pin-like site-specific DNA recombinase
MKRAIIYARCSTGEKKQDVEIQLKELRTYCKRQEWVYDEVQEYHSAYRKGIPPKLNQVLDLIGKGLYDIMIVFNLDRFSRLRPNITEQMLDYIVNDKKCRFIALQNNLDSDNEMMWYVLKGLWSYFSNIYSANLSERTKLGMEKAREKGKILGRPRGSKDKKRRAKKGYYKRIYKFKPK